MVWPLLRVCVYGMCVCIYVSVAHCCAALTKAREGSVLGANPLRTPSTLPPSSLPPSPSVSAPPLRLPPPPPSLPPPPAHLGYDKQRLAEEAANPVLLVSESDRPGTAPTK